MDAIKPGSIQGKLSNSNNKDKRRNIEWFLKACHAYGVPKPLLFQPEDLLFLRHIPRVTRCLFALGKKVNTLDNNAFLCGGVGRTSNTRFAPLQSSVAFTFNVSTLSFGLFFFFKGRRRFQLQRTRNRTRALRTCRQGR